MVNREVQMLAWGNWKAVRCSFGGRIHGSEPRISSSARFYLTLAKQKLGARERSGQEASVLQSQQLLEILRAVSWPLPGSST